MIVPQLVHRPGLVQLFTMMRQAKSVGLVPRTTLMLCCMLRLRAFLFTTTRTLFFKVNPIELLYRPLYKCSVDFFANIVSSRVLGFF